MSYANDASFYASEVNMPPRPDQPPLADGFRSSSRMPLDCAREQIYAAAREIEHLLPMVIPDFDTVEILDGAQGLHHHLLSLCLDDVCIYYTGASGKTEICLEELHVFESLFYITAINLYFFYTMLYHAIGSHAVDPFERIGHGYNYLGLLEHLYYHWQVLVDPQLLATLDFVVRKENLFKLKVEHNMGIFSRSRKFAKGQNPATMTASIRNALDSTAFDEAQLTPDILGLHELFQEPFRPSALLFHLFGKHSVALAGFCRMNKIQPSYSLPSSGSSHLGSDSQSSTFDKEDAFTLESPQVMIPEENMPAPAPANTQPMTNMQAVRVIANWLNSLQEMENAVPGPVNLPEIVDSGNNIPHNFDSGYDDDEETDYDDYSVYTEEEEMEDNVDTFLDTARWYAAKEAKQAEKRREKKRSQKFDEDSEGEESNSEGEDVFYETRPYTPVCKKRAPPPVDVKLANKKMRPSPKTPEDYPSETLHSYPTNTQQGFFTYSDDGEEEHPRLRGGVNMTPLPTTPLRHSSSPAITHPAETQAQHEHDMVLNGEMMQRERARAMRALLGEETEEDLAQKEDVASDSSLMRFWEWRHGRKKYW